ncbi:MAG TPA: aldo/keto reductase [Mycobacterium sp.]|nr:aldo/keto reductase [Mycobacterium sp.]
MGTKDGIDRTSWQFSRRQVLQIGGLGAAAAAGGGLAAAMIGGGPGQAPPRPLADGLITRRIPGTTIELPAVGLGTFQTFDALPEDERATRAEVLRRFWAAGGRVVDVSPLYGLAEENIARHAVPAGIQDEMFVTNKVWSTGEHLWDESHADRSLRNSMQRLSRTQPIDVMQCHSLVNVETIVPILHAWKTEGRVRRIGVTHHDPAYFEPLGNWVQTGDVDFVQVRYSIAERRAEERILPVAADRGVAVMTNMGLEKGRLHEFVGDRQLPDFASELGIRTWAQYFLKWVVSHPAVTVVLAATSDPAHLDDNMEACRGPLPDAAMRTRMLEHMQEMPGFDRVTGRPWYPGKRYPGVVNRAMAAVQARTSWRPSGTV